MEGGSSDAEGNVGTGDFDSGDGIDGKFDGCRDGGPEGEDMVMNVGTFRASI